MEYTLFLDESGNFNETSKMVSVVAGFLIEGPAPSESWAYNILKETKASDSMFDKINIDKFHGMNDYSEPMQEFSVRVMERLKSEGARIISFQSKKNAKIVDGDVTYLNVFALGLVRFFEKLIVAQKGDVVINVVYASRIWVEEKNINDRIIQIEMHEYKSKIEEHLALKMAQWPNQYRQKFNYTLTVGSARKNKLLMLADAINYGVRGGYQNFKGARKDRVRALNVETFKVHSSDKWTAIKNSIITDNLASGIISWYGDNDKELEGFAREFDELVIDSLSVMNPKLFSIQYDMLSAYITNIVSQRKLDYADGLLKRLQNEFLPLIQKCFSNINKYHFDIAFQRFTVASHKGDYDLSMQCINECDSCLAKLDLSYEALDYYFSYKIRVVEHLKNLFKFDDALAMLEKLEVLQQKFIDTYAMVGDFAELGAEIKSVTLGKIYGSMLQIYSQLVKRDFALLEKGRAITEKALMHFGDSFVDKSRIMQSRAALEYSAGNFTEALKWLSMSLGLDDSSSANEVLGKIAENLKDNVFILMHFAKLMGAAAKAQSEKARELLDVWNEYGIEKKLSKKQNASNASELAIYPYYVIYWNAAIARTILENYDESDFLIAQHGALNNPGEVTVYAAGLAISADRLYYKDGGISESDIDNLIGLVKAFINSYMPDNFKELFAPWEELLRSKEFRKSVQPLEREALKELIERIPVI